MRPDPHPPSADGVRELPEEIVKAIDELLWAAEIQGQDTIAGDDERTAHAEAHTNICRIALTAAILSRLGEAEAAEKELAMLRRVHRWNVEHSDGEVLVCRNNHDKGDDCDWERFVPEERLTAALARVEALEKALEEAAEWHDSKADNLRGRPQSIDTRWRTHKHVEEAERIRSALKDA